MAGRRRLRRVGTSHPITTEDTTMTELTETLSQLLVVALGRQRGSRAPIRAAVADEPVRWGREQRLREGTAPAGAAPSRPRPAGSTL